MAYRPTAPPATSPLHVVAKSDTQGCPSPQKAVTTVTTVTRLLQMSFEEFARAALFVELAVPWLEKHLWLVPDASCIDRLTNEGVDRGCIWTAEELTDLYAIDALQETDRRAIAALKAHFGIEILSVSEWEQLPEEDGDRQRCCYSCHGTRFWRSIHGAVTCATCHPPASQGLVAKWIDGGAGDG